MESDIITEHSNPELWHHTEVIKQSSGQKDFRRQDAGFGITCANPLMHTTLVVSNLGLA